MVFYLEPNKLELIILIPIVILGYAVFRVSWHFLKVPYEYQFLINQLNNLNGSVTVAPNLTYSGTFSNGLDPEDLGRISGTIQYDGIYTVGNNNWK